MSSDSHHRSVSLSDIQTLTDMLSYLSKSSLKSETSHLPRLNLHLKQLKSKRITLEEIMDEYPNLPWGEVTEEPYPGKRMKCELIDVEEVVNMDQIMNTDTAKISVLNEGIIAKKIGKGTISRECLVVLEKGVKIYMDKIMESVYKVSAARVISHLDNFPHHIITSDPQSILSPLDKQEKQLRIEQLKAAKQTKSSKHTSSDIRQAIHQAMSYETKASPQSDTEEHKERDRERLSIWLADVRTVLELDPAWRKSRLLQGMWRVSC